MRPALAATLTGSGAAWSAVLELLDDQPAVSATGITAAGALEALRRGALDQVRRVAAEQGVTVTPEGLASADQRVRAACTLALRRRTPPAPLRTPPDPQGFGVDVSTFPDLDRRFGMITGFRVVAEAVARRWITPRGTLPWSPSYGEDLRAYLSARLDPGRLAALASALQSQALEDERVTEARVTITPEGSGAGLRLRVRGDLVTAAGPFALVLTIDQLSVSLEVLRP